jgi:hypothetical protein
MEKTLSFTVAAAEAAASAAFSVMGLSLLSAVEVRRLIGGDLCGLVLNQSRSRVGRLVGGGVWLGYVRHVVVVVAVEWLSDICALSE